MLEFRTGTGFEFDVVVDRAFDIGRCEHAGRALAWTSATGFAGPWFYEPEGLGFFRGFGGGLLTTCGLEHALFMAEDTAEQYHYPPKQTETFGLHGRVSNRPARLAGYGERWEGDECVLYAEGEVLQAAVFGEQLLLRRRIEAQVGESRLLIRDEVVNVGHDRTPHMLLYHVNAGWPVVDEGSELLVPATAVEPRGDHAVEGYDVIEAPQKRLRRTGLRARGRRRGGRAGSGRRSSTAGSGSGRTRSSAATSSPTTSSGGCSAKAPTWWESSPARTAWPAGSTPAHAAS